jgi:hypothetical protein
LPFPLLSSALLKNELQSLSGDFIRKIKEVFRPAKQGLGLVLESTLHENYRHSRFSWIILTHQQTTTFRQEIIQIAASFLFIDIHNN